MQESFYKHLDSPPLVTISCRQLHNPEVQELLLRLWKVICSEFGGKIGEQEFCMLLDRLQSGMQSNIFNAVNLHLLDAYLIYFVSVLRYDGYDVYQDVNDHTTGGGIGNNRTGEEGEKTSYKSLRVNVGNRRGADENPYQKNPRNRY